MKDILKPYPKFHSDIKLFELEGIQIIGNFRNGAIIGLDDYGINFISKLKNNEMNLDNLTEKENQLFSALTEGGYFDPEIPKKVSCAYLHVTDNCNLHCIGCYSFKQNRNEKLDLSADQMKDILTKLKHAGVDQIVISGGEPFIREDLDEILKFAKQSLKISNLSVISNGTMPLSSYDKCLPYIDKISISIDGYDKNTNFIRDPGIMPKVFKTIEYLKNKIPVALIATLHKKTSPIINKYAQLSDDISVPLTFSILTVDYADKKFKDYILSDEDFENMNRFIAENQNISVTDSIIGNVGVSAKGCCGVGSELISIGADGAVYPCHMLHRDELILGNILTDNLEEILNSDKNIFKNLDIDNFEECSSCEYKYICGGGCRASSYYKFGDIFHPENSCKQTKAMFKKIITDLKRSININ